MTPEPVVSVIIPHLNQPDFLRRCLASLQAQVNAPPFEVIVVDNGSHVLPDAAMETLPGAVLVQETEPGPGPARNHGVGLAQAPLLAFIDADCTADPAWLAVIAETFKQNPQAGILGGDVRIPRAPGQDATAIEAYESIYAYRMKEYIARQGFTGTGNLAIRREIFTAVGPFGGIGMAEDRDWGQRATTMGHKTSYVAQMIVFHPARVSFEELAVKWQRHTAHDFVRMRAKSGWKFRWVGRAIAVAGSPVAEIVRVLRSDRVSGWRERLLAFAVLLRIRLYRARLMLWLVVDGDADAISGSWNR